MAGKSSTNTTTNVDTSPVRERILKAALQLFTNKGFHNVSVHDVQQQANVSIGSIYKHFGGKQGIAKELYYHLLREKEALIESAIANHDSVKGRCTEIIRLLFEHTETDREAMSFMLNSRHKEFLPDEPPICNAAPFVLMRDIMKAGIDNGELRSMDAWVATAAVFGGAIRLIQLRLDGIIDQPLISSLDDVLDAAWEGMKI